MDLLREQLKDWQDKTSEPVVVSRPIILIAPSWGKGNIIDSVGPELLKALLAKDYQLIVRPHPLLTKHSRIFSELMETYRDEPRIVFEKITTQESLFTADLMISDYSGVAYEFAFLRERPVLFIDVSPKIINSKWQSLALEPLEWFLRERIGKVVPPDNIEIIVNETCALLAQAEAYREVIISERKRYLYNYEHCGQTAALELEKLLKETKGMGES